MNFQTALVIILLFLNFYRNPNQFNWLFLNLFDNELFRHIQFWSILLIFQWYWKGWMIFQCFRFLCVYFYFGINSIWNFICSIILKIFDNLVIMKTYEKSVQIKFVFVFISFVYIQSGPKRVLNYRLSFVWK